MKPRRAVEHTVISLRWWYPRPTLARTLYIVIDTIGDGRVVGVFDSHERAARLIEIDPLYYKLAERTLNQIDPEALRWARSDEQRNALKRLAKK